MMEGSIILLVLIALWTWGAYRAREAGRTAARSCTT